jgi:hypothetical protein
MIIAGFIGIWHMPLFFVLAGWSVARALAFRSAKQFLKERGKRLLIPLLFGCLIYAMPIKYIELREGQDLNFAEYKVTQRWQEDFKKLSPDLELPSMPEYKKSFTEFIPEFFSDSKRFSWSHLWFLAYLLAFSIIYLPLLRYLRKRYNNTNVKSFWLLWIPLLILVMIQIFVRPYAKNIYNLFNDWANVLYFSIYFLSGYFSALFPELERKMHRSRWGFFALSLNAMILLLFITLGVFEGKLVAFAAQAVAGWGFTLFLLGIANQKIHTTGRIQRYLGQSAYPIYLSHQIVVVSLALLIIQLPWGILPKLLVLLTGSVGGVFLLYHAVLNRFSIFRFFHGIKQ